MSASSSPFKILFEVKSIHPVGVSRLTGITNDNCSICQSPLAGECLECQIYNDKECGISVGQCDHIFHKCCIDNWIEKSEGTANCPFCFNVWNLSKNKMI